MLYYVSEHCTRRSEMFFYDESMLKGMMSLGSIPISHYSQYSTDGVTKAVVCTILSVHIKDPLLQSGQSSMKWWQWIAI